MRKAEYGSNRQSPSIFYVIQALHRKSIILQVYRLSCDRWNETLNHVIESCYFSHLIEYISTVTSKIFEIFGIF